MGDSSKRTIYAPKKRDAQIRKTILNALVVFCTIAYWIKLFVHSHLVFIVQIFWVEFFGASRAYGMAEFSF